MAANAVHHPFAAIGNAGDVFEIADGIRWVRMPLPFALNHINLWLLRDGEGWTVVDTGIARPEVQAHWRRVLEEAGEGRPIHRTIVTHFHPDHLGNAGWFSETYGTDLWITHEEWLMGRLLAIDATQATEEATVDFYRRCDVEPENIFELKNRGAEYNKMVTSIPRRFRRMYEGDRIDIDGFEWEVITGFGHAPEHACLYCEERRLLLSGDQILPRITPFVGVHPMEPEANPLARFLDSLTKFRRLHRETLVLPAHELPFTGVLDRIEVMREHHEERLEVLHRACARPMTARAGVDVLFRRELDAQNLRLATNETLSHLNMLIARGEMERAVRGDGVWEFGSR